MDDLALEPMSQTIFRVAKQWYIEIKLPDWMFQLLRLLLINQSALFQRSYSKISLWPASVQPLKLKVQLENKFTSLVKCKPSLIGGQCGAYFFALQNILLLYMTLESKAADSKKWPARKK